MFSLEKWEYPKNYMGDDYPNTIVFCGRNRDSSIFENSNFDVALDMLGGESESVSVVRHRHWACGWVEYIMIKDNATDKIAIATKIIKDCEDYPVLSDDDYSEKLAEAANQHWAMLGDDEKIELCQKYNVEFDHKDLECIPQNSGALDEYLQGE